MAGRRTPGVVAVTLLGRSSPAALLAVAALAVATLSACSTGNDAGPEPATPQASPAPDGGTASEPVVAEAARELMQWVPAPGSSDNTVTTNGTWFLTVASSGTEWALDGPDQSYGSADTGDSRITNALLNSDWAVVVRQDQTGQKPDVAEVTDLSTGLQFPIDDGTDIPTTSGGTWALGGDVLVHATVTEQGETCLASVDLVAQKSTLDWCAGEGEGFTAAHVSAAGTSMLTYDDASPACRTVATVAGSDLAPFDGVAECEGWDSSLVGEDSVVWSTVPQDDQNAAADFYARDADSYYSLGSGTSGTLVPCGDSAYFVRDPAKASAPAQLVRWRERTLTVVYEAPPGQSFLEPPRCGDNALVVTALNEAGDEQVMAALG